MTNPSRFQDGLCRAPLCIRAHQLLSAVCVRAGVACTLMPAGTAQSFLQRIARDPTTAIRLMSDADEIPHHTVLWAGASSSPAPGAPVPIEVFNRKRDLDVLQRLALMPGDTRRARWLYELLFERIATPYRICAYDTPGWEGCPHAKSGAYERVRAQGWPAMVHSRTQDEMQEYRRRAAERIAQADRIFMRPHHVMCMACWYAGGEGQGPRPNDLIAEILERIRREPTVPLTLVEGTCDVCYCCDGFDPATTRCVHPGGLIRDYKKDLDVFQKLGLAPGVTLPAHEFIKLLFDRIPSTRDVCGYGDGIVRSEEWRICGDPNGNPGYAKSRQTGMP